MMTWQWKIELDNGQVIDSPSWERLYDVLNSMDGDRRSIVSLHLMGEGSLVAGGGRSCHIVTYMPEDIDLPSPILADPSVKGGRIEIIIEGVASEYPSWLCIPKDMMIEAFRHFFDTGALSKKLLWILWGTEFTETLDLTEGNNQVYQE